MYIYEPWPEKVIIEGIELCKYIFEEDSGLVTFVDTFHWLWWQETGSNQDLQDKSENISYEILIQKSKIMYLIIVKKNFAICK